MKRTINIGLTAVCLLVLGSACERQLQEELKRSLTPDNYFNSDLDAITAVNTVYSDFSDYYLYNQELTFTLNFGNDDILSAVNTSASTNIREIYTMNPSNLDRVTLTWGKLWGTVKDANFVIDGAASMDTTAGLATSAMIRRVSAEARFLRAMAYLDLTQLWGDLPKIDKFAKSIDETTALPKVPAAEIRAFIKEDLEWAADNLPKKGDYGDTDLGRITEGAAQALLAKLYLFDKEWQKAADVTKKVMDSDEYKLNPSMEKNFEAKTENGIESIFELQYAKDTRNNHYGVDYAGSFFASKKLINSYGPGDKRKGLYITNLKYRDGQPDGYYFRKYGWDPSVEYVYYNEGTNFVILRYADVLLMHAEALNELGKTADGINVLNEVRKRAGAQLLPKSMSQGEFREATRKERFMELCGETWRRFDLVRWGILVSTIKAFAAENPKGAANITEKNVLYPIPMEEIRLNPNLAPNNGY